MALLNKKEPIENRFVPDFQYAKERRKEKKFVSVIARATRLSNDLSLDECIRILGDDADSSEVRQIFHEIDQDQDGKVSLQTELH
jgi:hypothetical protein